MSQPELMIMETTFASREKALEVARLLVDAGLAICAQVGRPLDSFYHWKGEVCHDTEVLVVFKILGDRFDLFCGELKLVHPYDVPQMVAWPASYTESAYLEWAKGKGK